MKIFDRSIRSLAAVAVAAILVCWFCKNHNFATFLANGIHTIHRGSIEPHSSSSSRKNKMKSLAERWAISEPSLEFRSGDSGIVLNYDTRDRSSTSTKNNKIDRFHENSASVSASVSLWSKDCRSGGGTELKLPEHDGSTVAIETNPDFSLKVVRIDLDQLWKDFGNDIFDDDDSDETTKSIGFCVRSSLGAAKTMDDTNPVEMNFVESVVRVTATMRTTTTTMGEKSSGPMLEVIHATLVPVEQARQEQRGGFSRQRHHSTVHHNFAIQAFLCGVDGNKTIPVKNKFRQGSVVTLCVQPTIRDGSIRVSSIQEFTWTKLRKSALPLSGSESSINSTIDNENNNDSILARHKAIRNGAAIDMLTVYDGCGDGTRFFCTLSSILPTNFYTLHDGMVGGTGTVSLEFGTLA